MRGSMLDETYLTNDLANVDTPDFQGQTVNFQAQLDSALNAGQSLNSVKFAAASTGGANSADGSGVSSEQVSADISENGLLYQDLTQVAAAREEILKTAIGQSS